MNQKFLDTLKTIKSRGYWEIEFRPVDFNEDLIDIKALREIIDESQVELRGWPYPFSHLGTKPEIFETYIRGKMLETWINSDHHKEVWRIYQSGMFVHFVGLEDDWLQESEWFAGTQFAKVEPMKYLDIISTVYYLTEMFLFLSNLSKKIPAERFSVSLAFKNTTDRKLSLMFTPARAPLMGDYIIKGDFEYKREYSRQEIEQNALENTINLLTDLCYQFQWTNPPIATFRNDQKNLLERKLV